MSEAPKYTRRRFALLAGMALATGHSGLIRATDGRLPVEGEMPSISGATAWLNSKPLIANELRGKVVVVDFCTYTCINWLRSLPYVRAWSGKYEKHGLVVLGVHTPEFSFEKDLENVREGLKDRNIDYPIAVDSHYAIWRAFANAYWPALYFIDAKGRLRHHRFGEGEYQQSERVIQQLLAESGQRGFSSDLVSVDSRGVEAQADWENLRSPENYLGYERTQNFTSPGGAKPDRRRSYSAPPNFHRNEWALTGEWTMKQPSTILNSVGGRFTYQFQARDLHLVMGPVQRGATVRFCVLLDGKPPGEAHGVDIDAQGNGAIRQPQLYQLIRQPQPVRDRRIDVEFLDSGVDLYSVSFG